MPEATVLDLRGLKCPLPALRTAKLVARLAPGAELLVICTDPLASIDIPNVVREAGATLVEAGGGDGETRFRIRAR